MNLYTTEEIQIITNWYPLVGARAVQLRLKEKGYERTWKAIAAYAKRRGIKSESPTRGRFKKGMTPHSKGKKLSPERIAKSASTQFKKGSVPHNTLEDGVITIRRTSGREYKWIRLSQANWMFYHRYLWEKQHGKIPKGYVVTFKDGDRMNCVLDNLEMIPLSVLIRRNHNIEKVKSTNAKMTDKQIAGRIGMKNPELRAELLKHPELLNVARKRIHLDRAIKKVKNG